MTNQQKVCLIGGSGFLGTRLIDICKFNYEITNLDKIQSPFHNEITTIGDVRNPKDIAKAIIENETIVLLAAEHKDDVNPISLYYDVNVDGAKNVVAEMEKIGTKNLIFTSSVAVYGLNKHNPTENHPIDPFNHYGKSKWEAEEVFREWYNKDPKEKALIIIRPTVIFGERNRGNVYNLLKQITTGRFIMIGTGKNVKSMAYVGNISEFIKYQLENINPGYSVYNYIDKPDLTMNDLVKQVERSLNKTIPSIHLPYWLGLLGGYCFDLMSKITGKKLPISSVRVKKFCATTQFDAKKAHSSGFIPPFSLHEGLHRTLQFEFAKKHDDKIVFSSE